MEYFHLKPEVVQTSWITAKHKTNLPYGNAGSYQVNKKFSLYPHIREPLSQQKERTTYAKPHPG